MKLLAVLIAIGSFAAGFHFDRWLHRPIVTKEFRVQMPVKDSGIWPEHQEVCTAFNNICWYRI